MSRATGPQFDHNGQSPSAPYMLSTCAGVGGKRKKEEGPVAMKCILWMNCLHPVTQPYVMTFLTDEILTPNVALHHAHLKSMAHIDLQALIMLCKQINGSHNLHCAHKLDLGWVILGNVCL